MRSFLYAWFFFISLHTATAVSECTSECTSECVSECVSEFVPRLYYFDVAGKAEALRLACVHAGLAFEDVRLSREQFRALQGE
jgi:hypothetical protein